MIAVKPLAMPIVAPISPDGRDQQQVVAGSRDAVEVIGDRDAKDHERPDQQARRHPALLDLQENQEDQR